jgi:uncharacterized protein YxeA
MILLSVGFFDGWIWDVLVLLSIILTAVILVSILYYYSAKFDSHDIHIQELESGRKLDLIEQENLDRRLSEIQDHIRETKK